MGRGLQFKIGWLLRASLNKDFKDVREQMLWISGECCEAGASLVSSRHSKKVHGEAEQVRGKWWRWAWNGMTDPVGFGVED